MTIHLVTFSDASMSRSRSLCIESARRHGIDSVAGPHYFDPSVEYRDGFTFEWLKSQPIYWMLGAEWWANRGVGFWLFKPFLIDLVMNSLPDGDLVVYADAGVEFIDSISHVIGRMEQDAFMFSNMWMHSHWCKGDAMRAVFPNGKWEDFGKQTQASVILFRVSDFTRAFVREWLNLCLIPGLIDDSPSITPNHEQFQEHRHDQALLTCLVYKQGIRMHWWPAVYNRGGSPEFVYEKLPEYAGDPYPCLFSHHRRRNHEWGSAT